MENKKYVVKFGLKKGTSKKSGNPYVVPVFDLGYRSMFIQLKDDEVAELLGFSIREYSLAKANVLQGFDGIYYIGDLSLIAGEPGDIFGTIVK